MNSWMVKTEKYQFLHLFYNNLKYLSIRHPAEGCL